MHFARWRAGAAEGGLIWRAAAWLGYMLLVVWCVWWIANLTQNRMLGAERTWIRLPAFGVDFVGHVDKPARTWMDGGDPYADQQRRFSYPPIVTRLFMWVKLTDPQTSLRIWICLASLCAALGAVAVTRFRRTLGLEEIPISLALAAILFSTPVLFALERSNYDLLIVPCVVGAVALMRKEDATADAAAGMLLAIAIWAKLYPGIIILSLLALRRWRAAVWTIVFAAFIGLADVPELLRFVGNIRIDIDDANRLAAFVHDIHPWNHPLAIVWRDLWAGTPLSYIPGKVGAALLIGTLVASVSWYVYNSPVRERMTLPFLFWSIAAATFIPAISNDYNLTPLPLAALALWSRRYGWPIYAGLLLLAVWWQPIALPLPGRAVHFIKLIGLIAVAAILVRQAQAITDTDKRQSLAVQP
jgi:hypothetical protein